MSTRIPARAYHIDFETLDMPGALVAVEVTISKRIGRDKDVFRLDICDDPLYERLWNYCKNNPPRSKEP